MELNNLEKEIIAKGLKMLIDDTELKLAIHRDLGNYYNTNAEVENSAKMLGIATALLIEMGD